MVIGTPIANRDAREGLIRFFLDTSFLRTVLSGQPSFRSLLRRFGRLYSHQDLPHIPLQ